MTMGFLLVWIVMGSIAGGLGAWIAAQKNRDGAEGFLPGFLFSLFGCLIEAVLPTRVPDAEQGNRKAAINLEQAHAAYLGKSQAEWDRAQAEIDAKHAAYRAAHAAKKAGRREARVAYYRDCGVEPGPWAWFQVLPDWQQAIFMGLAFAGPVVGLIVFLMR